MKDGDARAGSVVGTAMAVLRCFGPAQPSLGVVEIAGQTGLHKSSISRLMVTLESEGLVERDPTTRKYCLGLGLLSVAGTLLANLDVRRAAYPALVELAARTRESCSLMLWVQDEVVCVEQVPSEQPIKHTTVIGTTYRTTASSSVQMFLSELPSERVGELVQAGTVALQGHPSVSALLKDLVQVHARGSAVNDGQTEPGEVGVSAVVRDHRGSAVAAILVSAPRFRVGPQQLLDLDVACRAAAEQVTVGLGGNPHRGQ